VAGFHDPLTRPKNVGEPGRALFMDPVDRGLGSLLFHLLTPL
jgi:hypothetical protein